MENFPEKVYPSAPNEVYSENLLPQYGTVQMSSPPPNIMVVVAPRFGETPVETVCPNCRANIFTQTKYETGIATWLIAGGCCLFGLWLGCCLLPFCVDSFKDVEHYCPNCRALVGKYKRI